MGLTRRGSPERIKPATLIELRAALESGASPAAALAVAADGPLEPVARAVRLGRPLADIAAEIDTGDSRADLLVRALALSEQTGTGGTAAIDQALRAASEDDLIDRLLDTHTVQARGTALLLAATPLVLWLLLVAPNPGARSFYALPVGIATAAGAVVLALVAHLWCRRIVNAARRAADDADILATPQPPRDRVRALAFALPMLVSMSLAAGVEVGLVAAAVAGGWGLRRPRERTAEAAAGQAIRPASVGPASVGPASVGPASVGPASNAGGGAETIELVGVALQAGLPAMAALGMVAGLAPVKARPSLNVAARRLRAGWGTGDAFADSPLAVLGDVLASTERWGAPAAPALRHLADDLRAQRRTAAEAAAERTQLALIFPTTLLMLPAFLMAIVPPLVWAAVSRMGGIGST